MGDKGNFKAISKALKFTQSPRSTKKDKSEIPSDARDKKLPSEKEIVPVNSTSDSKSIVTSRSPSTSPRNAKIRRSYVEATSATRKGSIDNGKSNQHINRSKTQEATNNDDMSDEDILSSLSPEERSSIVDEIIEVLYRLISEMDDIKPAKLRSISLGGELRGLLGKAEDEFSVHGKTFKEHSASDGVYIQLHNFLSSLNALFPIIDA